MPVDSDNSAEELKDKLLYELSDVKKFQEYIYGSLIENTLYMKRKYI